MQTEQNNNELNALINLLDEPSNQVFDRIRDKFLYYGIDAVPYLEDAWDNSFDNIIQKRIENLIHNIQIDYLTKELKSWKNKSHYNLLKGYLLITKYLYPDINEKEIRENIEKIKKDIWLELNTNLTALEKIKVINHIIFDIYRFQGNKTNIDTPQNLYLNNLLSTKKGNHLSLGMLYMIIAQSLNIPVYGVDLPHHFILAYVNEIADEKISLDNENDILFYINPFNKGAVFTHKEIEVYIKQIKLRPQKSFYKPTDNITIIKRLLANLITSYSKMGYLDKVEELKILEKAL